MKRKGEDLNDEELDELINQVDGSPSKTCMTDNQRTEINFETFKNYIYKLFNVLGVPLKQPSV